MSQVKEVTSPFFKAGKDVPVKKLLTVDDRSKVKNVLLPHVKSGKGMVATLCHVSKSGEVTEAYFAAASPVSVNGSKITPSKKIEIPTNQVFPSAPKSWMIEMQQDYSVFKFPASSFKSNWVEATDLGLIFMDGSGKECTKHESTDTGLTDFIVRLCIKATQDPQVASAFLEVAVPVTTTPSANDFDEYAENSAGYPVVFSFQQEDLIVGPKPDTKATFGLPCEPILWKDDPKKDPKPLDVLIKARELWAPREWIWPAFQDKDKYNVPDDDDDDRFKCIHPTKPSLLFFFIWLLFTGGIVALYIILEVPTDSIPKPKHNGNSISSTNNNNGAEKCVDKDITSMCETKLEEYPFFAMHYSAEVRVAQVKITCPTDALYYNNTEDVIVTITNDLPKKGHLASGMQLGLKFDGPPTEANQVLVFDSYGAHGKYVIVQQDGNSILNFAEIKVFLDNIDDDKYDITKKPKEISKTTLTAIAHISLVGWVAAGIVWLLYYLFAICCPVGVKRNACC